MRRILLCSLPLALALTACGSGEDETPQDDTAAEEAAAEPGEDEAVDGAQTVADGFVAALAAADGEAGCAFVDDGAQSAIAAQSEAGDCVEAFPDYVENLEGAEDIEVGDVTVSTDLDGETLIGNVELITAAEDPEVMEVREGSDGEWLATRVPGTTLGGA